MSTTQGIVHFAIKDGNITNPHVICSPTNQNGFAHAPLFDYDPAKVTCKNCQRSSKWRTAMREVA